MVNKLVIDLVCLIFALCIGNSLFLWIFIRRYSEEIRNLYIKLEEYERE